MINLLREHKLRILLSIFAILIFILSVLLGLYLLKSKQLSGSEFVAFIIAFAVIGLIISFSSEIQEFSLAGNIVKLKEVKKDAEKAISELKSSRTETFRFLLSLAKRDPGGFGDGKTVDSRLKDFWTLYQLIVEFGCKNELTNDIYGVVEILLHGQLSSIIGHSDDASAIYYGKKIIPLPSKLTIQTLYNKSIEKAAKRTVCGGSIDKIKEAIVIGLDEYKKLHDLYAELKNKI